MYPNYKWKQKFKLQKFLVEKQSFFTLNIGVPSNLSTQSNLRTNKSNLSSKKRLTQVQSKFLRVTKISRAKIAL